MILMHDKVTRKNLDHVNKDLICMYVTCETMSSMFNRYLPYIVCNNVLKVQTHVLDPCKLLKCFSYMALTIM